MSNDHLLLKNQLCFPIYASSRLMTRHYQPLLDKLNLTYPQYLVMMVLWEKEKLSVNEIGKLLILQSNTLTPIIKKMITKGYVEKKRSQKDERIVEISLTEAGKKLREQAANIPTSLLEEIETPAEKLLKLRDLMWNFLEDLKETE